ncbi:AAA family ATPase [Mannheimia sp. ZY171111]|nr:AAA family ATPase [Mannheimia sp. ZY171111]
MELDIGTEIDELYWKTKNYLEKIFSKALNKEDLSEFSISPYPIIWITSPNENYDFRYENVIYAPKFGWEELFAYLKWVKFERKSFYSVYHWSREESKNKKENYQLIDKQITLLIEQLEKDNKIGNLTKKKIDRLNARYSEDQKIYETYLSEQTQNNHDDYNDLLSLFEDISAPKKQTKLPARIRAEKELDKNLIVISGKAGSGKSFEIQTLMKKCYERSQEEGAVSLLSGYYLTYNQLLAKEIRLLTNQYQFNNRRKTAVRTLHHFFWRLSVKGLRILTIMTTKRREQLNKIQEQRYTLFRNTISSLKKENIDLDTDIILTHFSLPDREYILIFTDHFNKKRNTKLANKADLLKFLDDYHNNNLKSLQKNIENNTFLQDYYQVLRYILLAINNPQKLYEELEIDQMSDDEWKKVIHDIRYEYKADYKKTPEDFIEMVNRSLRGTRGRGKVLFIDEAQDCHELERDILLSMWQQRNIVVATGGREQLIRHNKECNWAFNGELKRPIHNIISIEKKNKTYRMKPALVKLCNFIAAEFQIKLDLSAHNTKTDDEGSVIIELHDPNYHNLKHKVTYLQENGKKNKLSPYESILFMAESGSDIFEKIEDSNKKMKIDEHNNLHYSENKIKTSKLSKYTDIPKENLYFHNQTNSEYNDNDEEQDLIHDTYRVICYESCRGLEAWSTVCLDLDLFYQRKYDEEIAATYLSDDLLLTLEERKEKYAANWVLMALTRAMDTVYIHLNDANSKLGKILQKYIAEN